VRAAVLVPTTAGGKLHQLRDGARNKEKPGDLPGLPVFISSHFCILFTLHYYRHTPSGVTARRIVFIQGRKCLNNYTYIHTTLHNLLTVITGKVNTNECKVFSVLN